ncbi:methyltransferase domain-containing protein, partial [Candidatus Omnitrophota bacterium]
MLSLKEAKYELVSHCDLCGGTETKLIDSSGLIVQCEKCGLRFVGWRLPQKDISQIYDSHRSQRPGWGEIKPEAQLMYQRRFRFVTKFIQRGKILDVGAGLGEFLSLAKRANRWQCFGTETSKYAIDFAKNNFDIEFSFGQLEELNYPQESFDVVSFWHVLEHLPYPSQAINKARQILKKDGLLFIAVPNDSWLGRRHFFKNEFKKAINRLPLRHKLKLKKMYPDLEESGNKHLFYFTPRTLGKLLKKHGFKVIKRSVDYDYGEPSVKLERRYKFDLLFCQ